MRTVIHWVLIFSLVHTHSYAAPRASESVVPESDPTTAAEMVEYFSDNFETPMISEYHLNSYKSRMENASLYLGDLASIEAQTASLFRQWLYLEIYRLHRYEYMMVNMAKLLPVTDWSAQEIIEEFDILFSASDFRQFPRLNNTRIGLRQQLVDTVTDTNKRQELIDLTIGNIESGYLTIAKLEERKKMVAQRFASNDPRYEKEMANIEHWMQVANHAQGIMQTDAFVDDVLPYIKEVRAMATMTEAASAQFMRQFRHNIDQRSTITDLTDFITGTHLIDLGRDLIDAMSHPDQQKFRKRVKHNLAIGAEELYLNLKVSRDNFEDELRRFNTAQNVIVSNTQTVNDNSAFHDWLIKVFEEQPLHWVITEEFSFMKPAADELTTLVNQRLRSRSLENAMRLTLLTGLFAITPLSRAGNQFSGWMTRRFFQGFRISIVVANAYVLSDFAFKTYLTYNEYRETKRLSRLSLHGEGLQNQVQENSAYWNLLLQGAVTGVSALSALGSLRNLFMSTPTTPGRASRIGRAAAATWRAEPINMSVWARDVGRHMRALRSSLAAMQPRESIRHLGAVGGDIAGILTQAVVMVPASLPNAVKSFLGTVPKQLYQGVTLGTVISIMGVTVQSYITAIGLQSFVWAFDQLGFVPPAYWQQNTLNVADRVVRDAIIRAETDFIYAKYNIANQVGFMTGWEALLGSADLTAEQRRRLQMSIEQSRVSIRNILKVQLMRWYLLFELRKYANSAMKDLGFGLNASPNLDEPTRMTMFITLGDDTFSYSATAAELERLRDQVVTPNDIDPSELNDILQRLAAQGGN